MSRNTEVVLLGDINSSPRDTSPGDGIVPPYRQLVAAGYLDAWTTQSRAAGDACCQDEDLRNLCSRLDNRIDHVFVVTPPVVVTRVERIGRRPNDRTTALPGRPLLWPSEHAAVPARLGQ